MQNDNEISAGGDPQLAAMRVQPHNLEAEQALLGAILVNNEAFHRVSEYLRAEHFFEPVHARIYEACADRIGVGPARRRRDAQFTSSRRTRRSGAGRRALSGPPRARRRDDRQRADFGRMLHDLALKRGLISVGEEVVNQAYRCAGPPRPAASRSRWPSSGLFELAQEGEIEGGFRTFPTVLTSAVSLIESRLPQGRRGHRRADRADRASTSKLGGLQAVRPA